MMTSALLSVRMGNGKDVYKTGYPVLFSIFGHAFAVTAVLLLLLREFVTDCCSSSGSSTPCRWYSDKKR